MKYFILLILVSMTSIVSGQGFSNLYSDDIPNYIDGPDSSKSIITNGILRISNVSIPKYKFFKSANASKNAPCVIICPGGGYTILAASHEGTDVAEKLNEYGIHALVLHYRLPNAKSQVNKSIAPLQDAQKAIYLVRQNAEKWGIDAQKIGIMGFSAGGHLAASAATHFDKNYFTESTIISLRPDFQILLYPVISMKEFGHQGSKNNLIGLNASVDTVDFFSNELHVRSNTPRTFIVHASDDGAVPLKNSIEYVNALNFHKIPVAFHVYPKGGHGFGMNNKTTTDSWVDRLINWMKDSAIL